MHFCLPCRQAETIRRQMPRPAETSIFFHCALSFDGVYALLSVYYNDPVGQFACPFCKRYFLLFLYVATQKPPRLPVTETGAVCYTLFVLFIHVFFKLSRNYLRGFLIAGWAGAKIIEYSETSMDVYGLSGSQMPCPFPAGRAADKPLCRTWAVHLPKAECQAAG